MRSITKHTLIDFEPLHVSCSIACATPHSPLTQVANTLRDEYEPDRSITPCVITPRVEVRDRDGIFPDGNANARLAIDSLRWKMNGIAIEDIPEFAGLYEIITTANELRGSLKLFRNTPVEEQWIISFSAEFEDYRRPKTMVVQSNELSMHTSDIGEDQWKISVDSPIIIYNPTLDNLLLFDYMKSNGLASGDRENYRDDRSYEKTVNMILSSGNNSVSELPEDMTLEISYKSGTPITPGDDDNPEVIAMEFPHVEFDLRLIDKNEYILILKREDEVLSTATVSVCRFEEPVYSCMPSRGSDVSPRQEMYFNSAIVNLRNRYLAYPEIYYKIQWFTQAQIFNSALNVWNADTERSHNIGRRLEIPLKETGIGFTKNNNYFTVGFDVEPHELPALATDSGGEIFTDEQNKRFII
jgi:hypothetical protein